MHADEVIADAGTVRRLLQSQFRQWAGLPVVPVPSSGTDNAIFRLGDDLCVRLPRVARVNSQVEKEQLWLSKLAPHLPLRVPVVLAVGSPGEGYPCTWSVVPWIEGEAARPGALGDPVGAAFRLAGFIEALQAIDAEGGPAPGEHNFFRGAPLAARDGRVREALGQLTGRIDVSAAMVVWEAALAAPVFEAPPVWIHGDLQPGNLIVNEGRLVAVIDFGGLGIGDPACDLLPAWTFFSSQSRSVFRQALAVDDATWQRGKGWALSVAVIALPYYWDTNPGMVEMALYTLDELLAEPDG
jgi:aminoglycoside phosphotransferase (APT) family kinase protein